MTTNATSQRIIAKPTLLDLINNHRCLGIISIAKAADLHVDTVRGAAYSNETIPQIAERIIVGVRRLTNHRYSLQDIELSVHPEKS